MSAYSIYSVNAYCFYLFVLVVAIGIIDRNILTYLILNIKLLQINVALFFIKLRFQWFFFRQKFK